MNFLRFCSTTIVIYMFSISSLLGQNNTIWTPVDENRIDKMNQIEYNTKFKHFSAYQLNKSLLVSELQNLPLFNDNIKSNKLIAFPVGNGVMNYFEMYETQLMHPDLAQRYPSIKTYVGIHNQNSAVQLNLTVTPSGVYVMVLNNAKSSFINPLTYYGDKYMFFTKDQAYTDHLNSVVCEVSEQLEENVDVHAIPSKIVTNSTLKQYRLALSCTHQYSNFHISQAGLPSSATNEEKKTAVLAAMVVTMNRVNAVYLRDVAVQLQLIENNDDLIQLNAGTDPYSNDDTFAMLNQNQIQVNSIIGSSNYDIGHVFSTGGGGVAALGSVCVNSVKAYGVTGLPSPVGDPYDIDYVAHEMGHQFGATHTYNNSCGGNRTNATAVEPGSGSTIMAYANICPPNVQGASDDYFHQVSVNQMYNFINSGAGGNCSVNIQISNTPPTINVALQDYTIPANTPFFLEVEASDPENDILSYTWEQLDNEISSQPPINTNPSGPNFRSVRPSLSSRRYFPNLTTVLNGNFSNTWEVLPFLGRQMNFGVLVRDNNLEAGQSTFDTTTITFVPGPFRVTSQNEPDIVWEPNDTETITWNVANTSVSPINSTNVDILLSTNIDLDFDVLLAEGIPNNGSAEITVPDVFAPSCRIMVKGSNNVFYALNQQYFSINSSVQLECIEEFQSEVLAIPDGAGQNQAGSTLISTLNFDQNVVIEALNVKLDISHTYIQDLVIELQGPSNEILTLFDRNCGSEENMDVEFNDDGVPIPDDCPEPFTGTYQPTGGQLNQWMGSTSSGDWSLLIRDFWDEDTGQLNSWSIEICTSNLSVAGQQANRFSIVPNPNNGKFQVSFSFLNGNTLIGNLYNLQGKLIKTLNMQPGALQQEVQFENLQQGLYFFKISEGNTNYVEKLLIR